MTRGVKHLQSLYNKLGLKSYPVPQTSFTKLRELAEIPSEDAYKYCVVFDANTKKIIDEPHNA